MECLGGSPVAARESFPGVVVVATGSDTRVRLSELARTEYSKRPTPPSVVLKMSMEPVGTKEFVNRQATSEPGAAVYVAVAPVAGLPANDQARAAMVPSVSPEGAESAVTVSPFACQVKFAVGGEFGGGVAPVGHPSPVQTLVDVDLARYDVVWAAAGHPHVVFPTTYDELVRITGGQAAEVA